MFLTLYTLNGLIQEARTCLSAYKIETAIISISCVLHLKAFWKIWIDRAEPLGGSGDFLGVAHKDNETQSEGKPELKSSVGFAETVLYKIVPRQGRIILQRWMCI